MTAAAACGRRRRCDPRDYVSARGASTLAPHFCVGHGRATRKRFGGLLGPLRVRL